MDSVNINLWSKSQTQIYLSPQFKIYKSGLGTMVYRNLLGSSSAAELEEECEEEEEEEEEIEKDL